MFHWEFGSLRKSHISSTQFPFSLSTNLVIGSNSWENRKILSKPVQKISATFFLLFYAAGSNGNKLAQVCDIAWPFYLPWWRRLVNSTFDRTVFGVCYIKRIRESYLWMEPMLIVFGQSSYNWPLNFICQNLDKVQQRDHWKMASPKNQLIFNPLPPCHSLSLIIFQLPLTLSPTNSEKVFSDKPSTNVYSYFNIMYAYYTKPHTRLPLPSS